MKYSFIYLIVVIYFYSCGNSQLEIKLAKIQKLPSFTLLSPDSNSYIDTRNIPEGSPLVFIYFSPDCEHCQRLTQSILDNNTKFKNSKIYLVSNESCEEINKFCAYFKLSKKDNVFVGKDSQYSFYNKYLPTGTPYIVVYNSRKDLKRIYEGDIDVNYLITALKEK